MVEYWLVVFPYNKFACFLNIKVACKKIVIMLANEFCSDKFQDVKKILVIQDIFDILPVFDWLFYSEFPCLFILAQQLL